MKTLEKLLVAVLMGFAHFNANAQSNTTNGNAILEEARKAIAQSNAMHFDLYAKNDGSVVKLFAEDACILAPNLPALCGREGIAKFFKDAYESGGVRSGKITTINIYGDGREFVTEEGLYQVFDANGKLVDDGKLLVLWKKTKEGWKDFRDSFSSNHVQK
ncbi:MAG TPA: nuclear transport factor 2 family protein [Cyclobacteriaceae bacterium]|nr:nuclear transport factor 2 family protein [Cyclobacteriaceae bacterium]